MRGHTAEGRPALGLRQGEALGLQWSDVNLQAQLLAVRRNRLRLRPPATQAATYPLAPGRAIR
jgi:integrase